MLFSCAKSDTKNSDVKGARIEQPRCAKILSVLFSGSVVVVVVVVSVVESVAVVVVVVVVAPLGVPK